MGRERRRSRERSLVNVGFLFTGVDTPTPVFTNADSRANTWQLSESMADFVEAHSKSKRYPDHPVAHAKAGGSAVMIPNWRHRFRRDENSSWEYGPMMGFIPSIGFAVYGDHVISKTPEVPSWLLDEFAWSASERFRDDLQAQGSILNFFAELKDFKTLFGNLKGILGRIHQFILESGGKPLLAVKFAIQPLIEDIQKFLGTAEYLKKRIEYLEKYDGQIIEVSYGVKDVAGRMGWSPETPPSEAPSEPWEPTEVVLAVTKWDCVFNAHASIRIDCKGVKRIGKQLDALMHALGVGSFFQWLEALYKGIPFTWLIDFNFPMKRFWAKTDVSVYANIEVLSTTSSLRSKCTVEAYGFLGGVRVSAGTYQSKMYWRKSGLPFDTNGFGLRSHSLTDNVDMLAILAVILAPGIPWHKLR